MMNNTDSNILVSFVILTWNSEKYIRNCIKSIDGLYPQINVEIFVIDNGSEDNTLQELQDLKRLINYPFKIISLPKNEGTTVSRNLAIKQVKGDNLIIMDSDVEFDNHGFKDMINYLGLHPKVGILAPKIVYPNGEIQHSCKKFPTFLLKILKMVNILTRVFPLQRDFYSGFPFDEPTDVDTAISAFWVMKPDIFNLIGYLDENIFYAPEDVDYCVRIWLAGKKVVFYPHFEVIHYTQQISHRLPFSSISRSHLKGLIYYFHKHSYWFSYKKIKRLVNKT